MKHKMITTIIIMATILVLPSVLATTLRIFPSDDAFVRDDDPNDNFNGVIGGQNLRAGFESSFGTDRSFLKFDLSEIQEETITSATFSAFALSEHDNPVIRLHHVTNNNWNENSITWNNKPEFGALIDSVVINGNVPGRIEFDIESFIEGNTLSLMMQEEGENDFVQFYSKDIDFGEQEENEFIWPYIEVEFGGEGNDCETGADTNQNGMIEIVELLDYISEWKAGNVDIIDLLNVIGFWKAGEGC